LGLFFAPQLKEVQSIKSLRNNVHPSGITVRFKNGKIVVKKRYLCVEVVFSVKSFSRIFFRENDFTEKNQRVHFFFGILEFGEVVAL